MQCPQCGKDTLSSEGVCRACSYQAAAHIADSGKRIENREDSNAAQSAANGAAPHSGLALPQEELPDWRKELARRLSSLKQKKETAQSTGGTQSQSSNPESPAARNEAAGRPLRKPTEHAGTIQVRSHAPKTPPPREETQSLQPLQRTIASLGPDVYATEMAARNPEAMDVRELIDGTVSRHCVPSADDPPIFRRASPTAEENKLILLSRTLAGLIDLIIVILCTTVFIISVDYFSGIVILDTVSIVEYAGLFLLVFLLYSIFFLATSGQTIGMMITDLRIIGIRGSRPSIAQLFCRCFGYLLSLLAFGAGLLWGLFDRDTMCLHDRFSNTSVTRL